MIETSRRRKRRGMLPMFAPVPRKTSRHDGWTPERQRGFIEALADTGSVRAAAHAVNMTPEGAYLLRRHPEAAEFRKAWEAALALGVQRLEDVAMDRALNGVEVPVYHFGAVIGTRRVYNDRLLMFLLRNRAPKRFKADSMSVVLKPDANTEVYLHLTLHQGSVDVETQLKRGDLAGLQSQWGQVQEAMARQGVRVGPLQGADTPGFSDLNSGGSSAGSGREQHPFGDPEAGPAGQPIFVSTQPAPRPQTPRTSRPEDRSWESWA